MLFWTSAAQIAAKLESMRAAEAKLLQLARSFGDRDPLSYTMELFDTTIPRSVVPLKDNRMLCENEGDELVIHGVKLQATDTKHNAITTPLVLQHGYMNGALYFYRNLVGLTSTFQTIFSIDMLGWGLSSRPAYRLRDNSVESTEDFFVESLEAWREKNQIDKMILAGHSMGGYLSVAYCERYPERVERLILLSPVGVPIESEQLNRFKNNATFGQRLFISFYTYMFESGSTPCSVLRSMPQKKAYGYAASYVQNRLPAITDPSEQDAVTDYLFYNSMLPASGEYCVNRVLNPTTLAKQPLVDRIPRLKVPFVSFLYGATDWMDSNGGLQTQSKCEEIVRNGGSAPKVEVFSVRDAGHLLMLDNWEEFNSGLVMSAGGKDGLPSHAPVPVKLSPLTTETQPAMERFRMIRSAAPSRRSAASPELARQ